MTANQFPKFNFSFQFMATPSADDLLLGRVFEGQKGEVPRGVVTDFGDEFVVSNSEPHLVPDKPRAHALFVEDENKAVEVDLSSQASLMVPVAMGGIWGEPSMWLGALVFAGGVAVYGAYSRYALNQSRNAFYSGLADVSRAQMEDLLLPELNDESNYPVTPEGTKELSDQILRLNAARLRLRELGLEVDEHDLVMRLREAEKPLTHGYRLRIIRWVDKIFRAQQDKDEDILRSYDGKIPILFRSLSDVNQIHRTSLFTAHDYTRMNHAYYFLGYRQLLEFQRHPIRSEQAGYAVDVLQTMVTLAEQNSQNPRYYRDIADNIIDYFDCIEARFNEIETEIRTQGVSDDLMNEVIFYRRTTYWFGKRCFPKSLIVRAKMLLQAAKAARRGK